ncbi:MAG: rhodanese-related sulfurtransferase [Candidatus Woesearchaeota archaeon]
MDSRNVMENILFYYFTPIKDVQEMRERLYEQCVSLGLKGTILLAKEGINGCLSGTVQSTESFMKFVKSDVHFPHIVFKRTYADSHTFKRLVVRVKNEIIRLDRPDLGASSAAPYVTPHELKELLDNDEVIMVDMRNDYEARIGKFKNAVVTSMETFRELPAKISELHDLKNVKDKKIVTYCTGGIRCEKATALLREHGFDNVYQLEGGIIEYCKACGNAHWEGKCFVFDSRLAIDIDPENPNEPTTIKEMLKQAILTDEFDFMKSAITNYKGYILSQDDPELHALYEQACEKVS